MSSIDFHWFSLMFHWFSLIFIGFHWFSMIFSEFRDSRPWALLFAQNFIDSLIIIFFQWFALIFIALHWLAIPKAFQEKKFRINLNPKRRSEFRAGAAPAARVGKMSVRNQRSTDTMYRWWTSPTGLYDSFQRFSSHADARNKYHDDKINDAPA